MELHQNRVQRNRRLGILAFGIGHIHTYIDAVVMYKFIRAYPIWYSTLYPSVKYNYSGGSDE